MAKRAKKAGQVDPRDASVVARAGIGPDCRIDIYRRESDVAPEEVAHVAARLHEGNGDKRERATMLRLAAALEEANKSNAPVCLKSDRVGGYVIYIESDGLPGEFERDLAAMIAAAKALGGTVVRQ